MFIFYYKHQLVSRIVPVFKWELPFYTKCIYNFITTLNQLTSKGILLRIGLAQCYQYRPRKSIDCFHCLFPILKAKSQTTITNNGPYLHYICHIVKSVASKKASLSTSFQQAYIQGITTYMLKHILSWFWYNMMNTNN